MKHQFTASLSWLSQGMHIIALWLSTSICIAQSGQWTWVKGPQAPGGMGSYGTQGVAAPSNHPPGLVNQFTWTALDGTLWLYGGQNSSAQGLAVLWKYDPATNNWTWVKGSTTPEHEGNFGVQGVAASTNLPPAKTFAGASWVDLDGNFWLYGGENGSNYNQNANNDLWKYEPSSNNWTWMKGSMQDDPAPVWGTMGVPDINNQPPPRQNCHGNWVDGQGDLWLFGGVNNGDALDDLWKYDIALNTWTWMNGSQQANAPAVYGTLGVQAAGNTPGARLATALGTDVNGMLWLIGGTLSGGAYGWGDLWRLDPNTAEWTWMGGSTTAHPPALMGSICVPEASNDPGRRLASPTFHTNDGRLWVFGDVSQSGNPNLNYTRSDLWSLCPNTVDWTWVDGPAQNNPSYSWGTLGVPSDANLPSGRTFGSAWSTPNDEFYLFGGKATDSPYWYGDLWKYVPEPGCGECIGTTIQEDVYDPLRIWPVPADDMIHVELPTGEVELTIIDIQGRTVWSAKEQGGRTLDIPTGLLVTGTYLIHITSTTGASVQRFHITRH